MTQNPSHVILPSLFTVSSSGFIDSKVFNSFLSFVADLNATSDSCDLIAEPGSSNLATACSYLVVRDSNDPPSAGFLRSNSFGQPVTTAGGVFGSGGPRAFQLAARVTF